MNSRARPSAAPARAVLAAVVVLGAAGCADIHRAMETPRVNPESPVAPTVAAGADRGYPYPLLRDVPPVPKNLPLAASVKGQVGSFVACRRAMAGYVVDHPPLSGQAAAFAADERAVAAITEADVPPPDSAAKAEAYAAQLRAEASPPAAIASGPAPTPQQAMPPAPAAPAPLHPAGKPHAVARVHPAPTAATPAVASAPPATASSPSPATPPAVMSEQTAAPPLPAPLADPLLAHCT